MSIRHVVFFHLNSSVEPGDPRLEQAIRAEHDLVTSAPGGQTWLFGPDRCQRPGSPDFVGIGDFASTEALQTFLAHSAHDEAARLWKPLAAFTVADLQI